MTDPNRDELVKIIEFPNSATPEQRAEVGVAMSALEQESEKWAMEIDLSSIAKMLAKVSPAGLNNSAPESVRANFLRRQEELIARMIEQAWIEGAYRGATGAFDAVRAGYDPATKTITTRAAQALSADTGGEDLRKILAEEMDRHKCSLMAENIRVAPNSSIVDQSPIASAALSAMERVRRLAPTGWRLVPEEPTYEMMRAAQEWPWRNIYDRLDAVDCEEAAKANYKAMLAAAPASPQAGEG